MRNLASIAEEVAKLVNDFNHCDSEYNFTRWTKQELIHYAEDAIVTLFTLLPSKFTEVVDVPLQAGTVQKLPADCVKITKVLGITDGCGALSSIASNGDDRLGSLFSQTCSESVSPSEYEITGYSIEETSDNIFYVSPPVPKRALPLNVAVICSSMPSDMDKDFVPETWMHNMIVEWVQYRAYSSEDESTSSDDNAKMHLEHFYAMIANFRKAEETLTSSSKRQVTNATAKA